MLEAAEALCPGCGRENSGDALVCALCGGILRHVQAEPAPAVFLASAREERAQAREESAKALEPWIYLGIGAVTALVFALTPLLGFMGWFLASLVHEMGHTAVAWFFGMPAFPAISLEGHAASVHSEPIAFLAVCVWAGLLGAAWHFLESRARWIALGIVGVLYPALAFTNAKECLHLLAGHGGELAFASLCLWKALDGGFTESRLERGLYGTVGWYLLGSNVKLDLALMFSPTGRAGYAENGSFGLTNDMIRVAEDVLGWKLQSVAFLMLLAAVAALAAAFGLWRISSSTRED